MFCMRCKRDVLECGCQDIDDRLRELCQPADAPGAVAAATCLWARSLARSLASNRCRFH